MKYLLSILVACTVILPGFAQDEPVFTAEISPDTVLYGNAFKVTYTLENAEGRDFHIPGLEGDFQILAGPNHASSISIVNGTMSRTMSVSYILQPREEGIFYIPPASIKADGDVLEMDPVEVWVLPNPEGIRQEIPDQQSNMFWEMPPHPFFSDPVVPEEQPKPKKKRKVTRI